jgi:hypothetical protein
MGIGEYTMANQETALANPSGRTTGNSPNTYMFVPHKSRPRQSMPPTVSFFQEFGTQRVVIAFVFRFIAVKIQGTSSKHFATVY